MVANGDAWGSEEVAVIRKETKAQGVMSARGLLANPVSFVELYIVEEGWADVVRRPCLLDIRRRLRMPSRYALLSSPLQL